MGAFLDLLNTFGVPIAFSALFFYMWNTERKDHKAEVDKMTEQHTAEVKDLNNDHGEKETAFTTVIAQNTAVMERLIDIFSRGGVNDGKDE